MRIKTQVSALLAPIATASRLAEKANVMPILSNLLLRASDGKLNIIGTDLQSEVTTAIEIADIPDGAVTVSAKKLADIIRLLPPAIDVVIDVADDSATLKCGKSKYKLSTLPATQYPAFEHDANGDEITADAASLLKAMESCAFAMAANDVRYYLNGMLLDATTEGRIRLLASDGHRLALYDVPIPGMPAAERTAIIPRKSVIEMIRYLGAAASSAVQLTIGSNTVRASIGPVNFGTKVIDGRFPDISRVLPSRSNLTREYVLEKESLLAALSRVVVVISDPTIPVTLTTDNGMLTIHTSTAETESAIDEVPVTASGGPLEIKVNGDYLRDAIKPVTGSKVRLMVDDDGRAIVVQGDDDGYLCLVMPFRN